HVAHLLEGRDARRAGLLLDDRGFPLAYKTQSRAISYKEIAHLVNPRRKINGGAVGCRVDGPLNRRGIVRGVVAARAEVSDVENTSSLGKRPRREHLLDVFFERSLR